MSCGAGHRHNLDLALLLWCRSAAAAPIQPLAWELPYVVGVALKSQKKKKKERKILLGGPQSNYYSPYNIFLSEPFKNYLFVYLFAF